MKKINLIILLFCLAKVVFSQTDSMVLKRQDKLLKILQEYNLPIKFTTYKKLSDFPKSDFFIPSIKSRFLELLTYSLNEEEKEAYREYLVKSESRYNDVKKNAQKIIQKDTSKKFEVVFDSIMHFRAENYVKHVLESNSPKALILSMAGYLDMQEAIPYLEAIATKDYYDKRTLRLALARLRVEPYYSEMIQECTQEFHNLDNLKDLSFIGTQESFYQIIKWLQLREIEMDEESVSDDGSPPKSCFALKFIRFMTQDSELTNMISEQTIANSFLTCNLQEVEFAIKWMEEHRGKYKFNRDFYIPLQIY